MAMAQIQFYSELFKLLYLQDTGMEGHFTGRESWWYFVEGHLKKGERLEQIGYLQLSHNLLQFYCFLFTKLYAKLFCIILKILEALAYVCCIEGKVSLLTSKSVLIFSFCIYLISLWKAISV